MRIHRDPSPASEHATQAPPLLPVALLNRRGAAMQVKQFLQAEYPGVEVTLDNYPVPALRVMLSKALSAAQMACIAVAIGGDQLLPMVGVNPPFPQWYLSMQQNRMGAAIGAWILGNSLNNMLISTGAFEVSADGHLVFSKMRDNRMPSLDELRHALVVKED